MENFGLRAINGVGCTGMHINQILCVKFLGLNSPASSPSVRDFSYVGMKSSLHIRPIVVNLCVLFCTWIVARYLSKKLKYTPTHTHAHKKKEKRHHLISPNNTFLRDMYVCVYPM